MKILIRFIIIIIIFERIKFIFYKIVNEILFLILFFIELIFIQYNIFIFFYFLLFLINIILNIF
jgi:hypothetical protein